MSGRKKGIPGRTSARITSGGINAVLITITPFFAFIQIYATSLIFRVDCHPFLTKTGAAVQRSPTFEFTRKRFAKFGGYQKKTDSDIIEDIKF